MRYCLCLTRGIQRCVNMDVHRNASCFWLMEDFSFPFSIWVHRLVFVCSQISVLVILPVFNVPREAEESRFFKLIAMKKTNLWMHSGLALMRPPPRPRPLFHPLSPPAKTKSNILLFIQLNWKWRFFFSTSDVHIVNDDLYRRSNAFFIYIFTTFKMHLSLSLCFSQKTEYLKRQTNVFSGICKRNLMV